MSSRIPDAVMRVLTAAFAARDVAEPLASFDAGASGDDVRSFMEARGLDVVGVRSEGQVVGFVERTSLQRGTCGEYLRRFEETAVFNDTAPLLTVLRELERVPFLFVSVFGKVGGIVARADLQKPVVRMWLFGVVTLIEMRFMDLIEAHCPGDSWKEYLSEARLQKARALLDERSRRDQALRLFDCLQFSDKGQIVARNEAVRKLTIFPSRRRAEEVVKRLEQLRNNLAHAQDILSVDWPVIVELCEFIVQHTPLCDGRVETTGPGEPCP
jgi:hypothetical protein